MNERNSGLAEWLRTTCKKRGLSLRQTASNTGLSHATIDHIMKGGSASAETIKKLAQGFSTDHNERLALEDSLFVLAGYRTLRPEEELNEPLAQLLDKLSHFNETQLHLMGHFADYISKMEKP